MSFCTCRVKDSGKCEHCVKLPETSPDYLKLADEAADSHERPSTRLMDSHLIRRLTQAVRELVRKLAIAQDEIERLKFVNETVCTISDEARAEIAALKADRDMHMKAQAHQASEIERLTSHRNEQHYFVTPKELACLLQLPIPSVRALARKGLIPSVRIGRLLRFRREDIATLKPSP